MSKKIYFDMNKNLYVEIIYHKINSSNIKSIFYYLDSNRTIYHNNNGPAIITYNTNGYLLSEEFYINGKFNNPFSTHDNILPSRIWYHNNVVIPYKEYYYINNVLNNINTFNIDGKCIESLYNINSNYVNSIFYKNIKPYITKTEKYLLNNNINNISNNNIINNNNISNNNINNIINKIFSGELLKEDIEESNRLSTITNYTKSKKIKMNFKNKNFGNKNLKSINLI